jgi:hypothetical protein
MAIIADKFPELEILERSGPLATQEAGQGKSWWEAFFPKQAEGVVTIVRAVGGIVGLDWMDKGAYAAAEMQALQASMAAGIDPETVAQREYDEGKRASATPTGLEYDQYRDRIHNFARIFAVVNSTLYSTSPLPAGSKLKLDDLEISQDVRDILWSGAMPHNEAKAELMRIHPDATPWTVFGTKSASGAPIFLGGDAYQFMNDNGDFLKEYPMAGAWFMPPNPDYSNPNKPTRRAQAEGRARELKIARTPEQFMEEIYYQDAANEYYRIRDEWDKEIYIAKANGQDASQIEAGRDAWNEEFLATHKTFSELRGRNSARREETSLERDRILLMDRNDLPGGQHTDNLLGLMSMHKQFNQVMDSIQGSSRQAVAMRDQVRTDFMIQAAKFTELYPDTKPYFQSNIRWDKQISDGGPELIWTLEAALGRKLD